MKFSLVLLILITFLLDATFFCDRCTGSSLICLSFRISFNRPSHLTRFVKSKIIDYDELLSLTPDVVFHKLVATSGQLYFTNYMETFSKSISLTEAGLRLVWISIVGINHVCRMEIFTELFSEMKLYSQNYHNVNNYYISNTTQYVHKQTFSIIANKNGLLTYKKFIKYLIQEEDDIAEYLRSISGTDSIENNVVVLQCWMKFVTSIKTSCNMRQFYIMRSYLLESSMVNLKEFEVLADDADGQITSDMFGAWMQILYPKIQKSRLLDLWEDSYNTRDCTINYEEYLIHSYIVRNDITALHISSFDEENNLKIKRTIITIRASDVAACIGMNSYKSSEDELQKLWFKYQKSTAVILPKEEQVKLIIEKELTGKAAQILQDTLYQIQTDTKESQDVARVIETRREQLKSIEMPNLSVAEKEVIIEHLVRNSSQAHGIKSEDKTATVMADAFTDETTILVPDNTLYRKTILDRGLISFQISGKIDRIQRNKDEEPIVVEIKNRVHKLFYKLRGYENIQVQTYLYLTEYRRAKLVEQYNNKTHEIDILRDDAMIELTILPKLIEFSSRLYVLLTDETAREEYARSYTSIKIREF